MTRADYAVLTRRRGKPPLTLFDVREGGHTLTASAFGIEGGVRVGAHFQYKNRVYKLLEGITEAPQFIRAQPIQLEAV